MLIYRASLILIILLSIPNSYAASIFEMEGIRIVPAIVHGNKVYIQPLALPSEVKQFYLLGKDGKNHELRVDNPSQQQYEEVNWGFGESEAISLSGLSSRLPGGELVAFGEGASDKLRWVPANIQHEQISDAYSDSDYDDYLSCDVEFGMTRSITYKCASIPGMLFYATYRKLMPQACDPQAHKKTFRIINSSGEPESLIDSFVDCDGQSDFELPLGPILGALEFTSPLRKKIWIVMAGEKYETTGITLIPYDPVAGADIENNVFIVTGAL